MSHIIIKKALKHEFILKKAHRTIKFKQKNWLEQYVSKTANYRTTAKIDFEKTLYKLLNNSLFDKTIQDKRKERNRRFATNERTRNKFASSVSFNGVKFISDDLDIYNNLIWDILMY